MKRARLALPVWGKSTRRRRLFASALVATLTFGLAAPAQAGLGDLLDPVIEDLPIVDDIVDPIIEEVPVVEPVVEDLLAPAVDEAVAPILSPAVEEILSPVIDEVLPPADEVEPPDEGDVPPVEEVVAPVNEMLPVEGVVPPGSIESVTLLGTSEPSTALDRSTVTDIPRVSQNLAGRPNQSTAELRDHESLVLAQTLQTDLARRVVASPTVAASLVDSPDSGWLVGLTDWLSSTGNRLADLLAIPLRLLEILARALLTAGSGLVAPASLALAFTIYAVRDRRWQGLGRTVLT